MNAICKYPKCGRTELVDGEHCLFHAPKDKKGINNQEFITKIHALIAQWQRDPPGLNNFEGFIFPSDIDLSGLGFRREANFAATIFHGRADFTGTAFNGEVVFDDAQFLHGVKFEHSIFKSIASFAKAAFILDEKDRPPDNICADFTGAIFNNIATFNHAQFANGIVTFLSAQFHGETADFTAAQFRDCQTNFNQCEFGCKSIQFNNTVFAQSTNDILNTHALSIVSMFKTRFGGQAEFMQCRFERTTSTFERTAFEGGDIFFIGTKFHGGSAHFIGCRFDGGDALFYSTEFKDGLVAFEGCRFNGNITFRNNPISGLLYLSSVELSEKSVFELHEPRFLKRENATGNEGNVPCISFSQMRFNPLITFFQKVRAGDYCNNTEVTQRPILLFRYCVLKDVYISNSDMGLFSFFTSYQFEEAIFISCQWIERRDAILGIIPIRQTRRYQIAEEELLKNKLASFSGVETGSDRQDPYELESLENYHNVADLYMRFKTAADRAKDYHLASGFYFNEFEMKRRAIIAAMQLAPSIGMKFIHVGRLFLYNLYKILAGYGEYPRWSSYWLLFASLLFPVIYLYRGFKIPSGSVTKYSFALQLPNIGQAVKDFLYALVLTYSRIIPSNLLPFERTDFGLIHNGLIDILISISNIATISILFVLMGVGLKRHFRRF